MAKTRSMTRNQYHGDDASRRKRIMTCDSGDGAPWSDLNHDLLFLIMMKLGVIEFISFSGVCNSWRSLALSNKNKFMASKPPMSLCISSHARKKACYLVDFEGRKFKTILPHSAGRTCFGLACGGYLILFGKKTCDFWLVNPITRHELHFPDFPGPGSINPAIFRAMLVFSPSISRWVFVMVLRFTYKVWFSIAGTRAWNHVSSTFLIVDLHVFKGKIYTLDTDCRLCELILDVEPKFTLLEINNILKLDFLYWKFVSSGENLYVMGRIPRQNRYRVRELDFGEMKSVSPEKTIGEYALFLGEFEHGAAFKQELWAKSWSQYERYVNFLNTNNSGKCRLFTTKLWYFPHDCLNVNILDE